MTAFNKRGVGHLGGVAIVCKGAGPEVSGRLDGPNKVGAWKGAWLIGGASQTEEFVKFECDHNSLEISFANNNKVKFKQV